MARATLILGSALLLALPTLSLAQPEPPRTEQAVPSTITVTGSATVRSAPNEATVLLGVTRQAPTAQEAQNSASATAQQILEAVTRLGVERNRIQTSRISLFPVYSVQRPGRAEEEPRIVAYRASNVVSVRLNNMNQIGPVIDAATRAGANEVRGVQFTLTDDTARRSEALRLAVREAREKATSMAEALGVSITGVQSAEESVATVQPFLAGQRLMAAEAATPIEPGEVEVTANVTVRYRFTQGRR